MTPLDPRTGIATPLSGLRRRGHGIGEYIDLPSFGAWAKNLGFDLIQILPVQDTGDDPSPYSGSSAVALHPIYLNVEKLTADPELLSSYATEQRQLSSLERVDYKAVLLSKSRALRKIFDSLDHRRLEIELETFATKQSWVHVYCAYKILRAVNGSRPWREWPRYRDPRPTDLEEILESHPEEWLYHSWLQYQAHRQLLWSRCELDELGVSLKGDVPIMLQEESADVWFYRDLFNLEGRAGAPPDIYCEEGQYWAFPCYRWDRMRDDDYAWWRRRIRHSAQYYRALRIDHVLGFFRIWQIDLPHRSGTEGRYVPTLALPETEVRAAGCTATELATLAESTGPLTAIPEIPGAYGLRWEWANRPDFQKLMVPQREALRSVFLRNERAREELWGQLGRERLRALCEESDMILCAEDLGAVPDCVGPTLDALGIAGLRVERWSRAEKEPDRPFWDPAHFPRLSVCAPGLHDASSIRGWWEEEDPDTRALYYHRAIGQHGAVPEKLNGELVAMILGRNLRTSSQLCVLMLPDCLAIDETLRPTNARDERINVPGTLSDENWSWRMPMTLDDLDTYSEWDERLRELVAVR